MASTVSIGLPVYNGAEFLGAALGSLLAQDHGDFELIISDNASTDGTADICADHARRDRRIRYSRNAENIGANRNFMRVLEQATGTFFMWSGHDDLWAPDYVSRLLARFSAGDDVVLAAGRTHYIDALGNSAATSAPAPAPPAEPRSASELVALLLSRLASSWFYGLYRRETVVGMLDLLERVPLWGGDLMFLLHCIANHQVVGDEGAIIYKRVRYHNFYFPKTPRAWVRWQAIFTTGMLGQVLSSNLSTDEKLEVIRAMAPPLSRIVFKKGFKGTAVQWLRAAYQFAQGQDHA